MPNSPKQEVALKQHADKMISRAAMYKKAFCNPEGEKVLFDMMNTVGLMEPSIGTDMYETSFNEGKKYMVYELIKLIDMDPGKYKKLIEARIIQSEESYE